MWIVFDAVVFLLRGLLAPVTAVVVVVVVVVIVIVIVTGAVVPLRHRLEFSHSIHQQQSLPSCLR
jgi:hypothetical protein